MLGILRRWAAGLGRLLGRRLAPGPQSGPHWGEAHYRRAHGLARLWLGQPVTLAYWLYVPAHSARGAKLPLLVMLHGCRQDAQQFAAGTRMNRLAEQLGFVVLYPQQSARQNALHCWTWFRDRTQRGEGETALIAGLIDELRQRYPIDEQRLYAAGMSAGAAMARLLSLRATARLAACAMHSGLMYRAATDAVEAVAVMKRGARISPQATARELAALPTGSCAQVPTLAIHGAADQALSPVHLEQLREQFLATDAALRGESSSSLALQRASERRAGRMCVTRSYSRDGLVLLRTVLIERLGHAWSGGDAAYEFNDAEGPDASRMIWEFLARYRLGEGRVTRTTAG